MSVRQRRSENSIFSLVLITYEYLIHDLPYYGIIAAQLWKFEKKKVNGIEVKQLKNKEITHHSVLVNTIPFAGQFGYVEISFSKVLGLEKCATSGGKTVKFATSELELKTGKYSTLEGTNVIIEDLEQKRPVGEQMWFRSHEDENGWFTLRNRACGKFLTSTGEQSESCKLTIQGTNAI